MQDLYGSDTLTLAKDHDDFDHSKFNKAAKHVYDQKGFNADMMGDEDVQQLTQETYRVLASAINLKQEVPDDLKRLLEQNTFVFSGFKTYHELREVSSLMQAEDGGFKAWNKFKQDVLAIDNRYNKNYLRAEYQFAVQSAQMASKWKEFEQDGDAYLLQYRTAGDEKVRSEHAALHMTTLPMSDKFWDEYLPPLDWGCRCTTVQVRRDKYPQSNSQEAIAKAQAATDTPKKQIFRFNPGKTGKLFPPKHPYLPKGCGNCDKNLRLAYDANSEQCKACAALAKCWKEKVRTEASRERFHYLHEMEHLLSKKVVVNGNGHSMSVGFDKDGNKHLYSDTYSRSSILQKEDLKDLDKLLANATFVKKSALSKPRKDEIKRFYYYAAQLHGQTVYLNVAECEHERKNRQISRWRILYSVTDHIK